jgi:queuine tRNA-ribosyltransferase
MDLGSDIIMAFDECTPFGAEKAEVQRSMELSMRWAERSRRAMTRKQSLFFGIVQGGMHVDLRQSSIATLKKLDCDGIALGGLSVGEPIPLMHEMLANIVPLLPTDKPRYVMGVGTPLDLLVGIDAGVDMFDCVIPTRNARNGSVFTSTGTLSIKQAAYVEDAEPLDKNCRCKVCNSYSRAYLRHLYVNNEILSSQLLTFHNLFFYNNFISECRKAIEEDRWQSFFHEQKNLMMRSASASTDSI